MSCNVWSYGIDSRSIRLTVVKVVVSSEGTCTVITVYLLKCLIIF